MKPALAVVEVVAQAGAPVASASAIKDVFARLARGVAVVTSQGEDGPCGMTATSVSSLSLDPPLAIVCMGNRSRTLSVVAETRRFAFNILTHEQLERSRAFAAPRSPDEPFTRFPFEARDGVPLLPDALAWAICRVEGLVRAGDHTIAIGLVQDAGHADGEPLVWHRGAYRGLAA